MASSSFPSVVTGVTVDTATSGALSGDGSNGNKLMVNPDGVTIDVNASNQLTVLGAGAANPISIGITIDGGGSAITTGTKGFIVVSDACTINQATLLSTDASVTAGSIVIDVWKAPYANYPPTVSNTITASAKPTLSNATKSQDATLTGWTTAVSAGDVIGFHVDSATTVTRVTLQLRCQP